MSRENIHIQKLKKGNRIILETKETVFEIVISNPSKGEVNVHGGIQFMKTTMAIIKKPIKKNSKVEFAYELNGLEDSFITSNVVSATVYGSGDLWHYDAIEKK